MIHPAINPSAADQKLRPTLEAIDNGFLWLQRTYGNLPIERITVDAQKNAKPKRLPLYLASDEGRYEKVYPDEKQGGLLFLVQTGDVRITSEAPGIATSYNVQMPLALYLWGKLADVGHDADNARREVMQHLARLTDWQTTGYSTQLQERLFRELDYDFINHRYLMHPFFGIRIEGTLNYTEKRCC